MNSNAKFFFGAIFAILLMFGAGYYLFEQNIGTVNIPSTAPVDVAGDIATNTDKISSLPGLKLPAGFSLKIFAKNIPGARVIEIDPKGRILVSETSEGKIVALTDLNADGVADSKVELASGLKSPHGMAMSCAGGPCFLYVAESNALSRYSYDALAPSLGKKEKLFSINTRAIDRHFTRSLLFLGPPNQDTLLISIGSSCDVCHESSADYASILSYNIKTGEKSVYAKGLRNATFMTLNPVNGKVFATEMGRDNLGDNIPPDEINIIENKNNLPQNYGWPICYGQNIHDDKFDKNTYIRNPCMLPFETPAFLDLQAHSAPLGLAFIPQGEWPKEYWNNLLVAFHGSWNRSVPTGYKIVRIKMDNEGNYIGTEDFITGWLNKAGSQTGRPVDIKFPGSDVAYISDDSAGVIYRLSLNR